MTAAPTLLARVAPLAFIFLWSMAFVAVRTGLPDVSPLYFLAVRFALATAILVAIAALWRLKWSGLAQTWRQFVVAGVLMNALYLSAGYLAMTDIAGATLALIGALHPLLTALLYMLKTGTAGRVAANFYLTPGTTAVLGWLILGEALSPLAILGFAIASAGVWLVHRAR